MHDLIPAWVVMHGLTKPVSLFRRVFPLTSSSAFCLPHKTCLRLPEVPEVRLRGNEMRRIRDAGLQAPKFVWPARLKSEHARR